MRTIEEKNTSADCFTDKERNQINEQLTKAINSKKRIPVDEKFWQERKTKLDNYIKESGN